MSQAILYTEMTETPTTGKLRPKYFLKYPRVEFRPKASIVKKKFKLLQYWQNDECEAFILYETLPGCSVQSHRLF